MNVQTAYPVFEDSQVLTSTQLNDLTEYLEEQDRLSRRTLTGIGVVCGFDVDAEGTRIEISKGVAVTSEGFLICSEAQTYDRFRPYAVPVPTAEEADEADIAEARYPFLFPDGETQIPVFELLDTDFAPAPGEADPTGLSDAFLADKTVMLFLECRLESLKSCDINDCSDKGAERRFTLRRLLVTRAQADAMIAQERAIAGRPTDLNTHPRNDLPYLRIEKLALARTETGSFAELLGRILTIAVKLSTQLPPALRDSYAAYEHLLGDMFADADDPFPNDYFSNVWGQLALNVFMAQYFYDYMRDVAMAYNEFTEAAACFEAECLPDPDRFPKHVLLGDATNRPDAFATTFANAAEVIAFNQSTATAGIGLQTRPAARRTHFTPSPAAGHQPRLEEVRALFLRMHLLAYSFRLQGIMGSPVRLTPSRWREAPLSERAIPYHYIFTSTSDIYRNWSPRKTKARLLSTVYSYRFSQPDDDHPFHFRIDDQDFIRVEGIVGKPLGSTMAELIAWKKELGLSFSIEPVFMRLAADRNDRAGTALDQRAAADAAAAARKLILCRLSDLDIIFLVLIGAIFAFLVFLIQRIGRLGASTGGGVTTGGLAGAGDLTAIEATPAAGFATLAGGIRTNAASAFLDPATAQRFRIDLSPEDEIRLKADSDQLRADFKTMAFDRGDIVARLNPEAAADSAATVFAQVKDDRAGGNLFDRTRAFVARQGGDEIAVRQTYAKVAVMNQAEQVMDAISVDGIADFDEVKFATAYKGFADSYQNYAATTQAAPPQDAAAAQEQVQIAAAAGSVASQTSVFAAANIQREFSAAVLRIFESLTLEGYASRHPGLEHHAGVPVGGTLVLGYVSLADLAAQAAPILGVLGGPTASLNQTLAQGAAGVALQGALQELAAAVDGRTDDPLDQFVIMFDACLPYQCCDADCSDVALSERIIADPFGDDVNPAPMAVPPIDAVPDGRADPPGAGVPRAGASAEIRRPTGAEALVRRGLTAPVEAFVRPTVIARDPLADALRRRVEPTPGRPAPDNPPADPPADTTPATVFGEVGLTSRGRFRALAGSEVVFTDASGRERRVRTDGGAFKIAAPPGSLRIRGAAAGHRGTSRNLMIEPGEERELQLIVTPQG